MWVILTRSRVLAEEEKSIHHDYSTHVGNYCNQFYIEEEIYNTRVAGVKALKALRKSHHNAFESVKKSYKDVLNQKVPKGLTKRFSRLCYLTQLTI